MTLPSTPTSSWLQSTGFPSRLFEQGSNDYELYEEDDEFVLSVEMPGFYPEEISVAWDDGVLNIAAEHEDEARNHRKTYHRRFRFPKLVEEDAIEARYNNGILEVTLPVEPDAVTRGRQIEIQS